MNKRDIIIKTTIQLFATEGVAVPTLRIANESGVSNGTLFNYFPTKQILINEVFTSIKKEMINSIALKINFNADIKEILYKAWTLYVNWALKNKTKLDVRKSLLVSHVLSSESLNLNDHIINLGLQSLEKGSAEKKIINLPAEFLYNIGKNGLDSTVDYAFQHKLQNDELKEHIESSFAIYWNGIKK